MRKMFYLVVFSIYLLQSCTEPYGLQANTFESAVVIEASITNENKFQEVKLSRTYKMEEDGPDMETGAVVYVTDSNGNQYNFSENGDKYISQQQFQAQPSITYQLHVITSDGKTYTSANEKMTSLANIDDITTSTTTNNEGKEGVQMIVTGAKSSTDIEYYRFTYEETNKVIAPYWIDKMAVVTYYPTPSPDPIGEFNMVPWTHEARYCYPIENSTEIFIENTAKLNGNTFVYPIRFIDKDDYKIANRYSIKVTMHNESLAAYSYYDALKKNSTGGSILSQNQPGFYSGNIKNSNNLNEKVIGFFEVSHVSSKRLFFNFEEIFPNEPRPKYPYECYTQDFEYCFCFSHGCPVCDGNHILDVLSNRSQLVYKIRGGTVQLTSNVRCGDCSTFASNVRPAFWID